MLRARPRTILAASLGYVAFMDSQRDLQHALVEVELQIAGRQARIDRLRENISFLSDTGAIHRLYWTLMKTIAAPQRLLIEQRERLARHAKRTDTVVIGPPSHGAYLGGAY
jgi:hypothetical protein